MGTGPLSSGLSWLELEGEYAVPSNAVIKNEWRYFYACCMCLNVGYMFGHMRVYVLNLKKDVIQI